MHKSSSGGWSLGGLFILWMVLQIISANYSDTRAMRAAASFGLADARITDSNIWFTEFMGCGLGGMKQWEVTGTNPLGQEVTLIVCGTLGGGNYVTVP